jgi:hypothetical protein
MNFTHLTKWQVDERTKPQKQLRGSGALTKLISIIINVGGSLESLTSTFESVFHLL